MSLACGTVATCRIAWSTRFISSGRFTLGVAVARLCAHPNEQVPEHDNLVAQKLMLENDVGLFRRTANRTQIATRA
jgi:hypothetical protein